MNHDNKGGWVAQNCTQMDVLRSERRWLLYNEQSRIFTIGKYIGRANVKSFNEELGLVIFPSRGESILQPGQIAVSREDMEAILQCAREGEKDHDEAPEDCADIRAIVECLLTSPAADQSKCKCNFRQRLVGDGCDVCNPELAAELEKDDDQPEPSCPEFPDNSNDRPGSDPARKPSMRSKQRLGAHQHPGSDLAREGRRE